jgi:hypothetical protein
LRIEILRFARHDTPGFAQPLKHERFKHILYRQHLPSFRRSRFTAPALENPELQLSLLFDIRTAMNRVGTLPAKTFSLRARALRMRDY